MRQDVEFLFLEAASDRAARNEQAGSVEHSPSCKAAAERRRGTSRSAVRPARGRSKLRQECGLHWRETPALRHPASNREDYNAPILTDGGAGARNERSKPRLLLAASIRGRLLLPLFSGAAVGVVDVRIELAGRRLSSFPSGGVKVEASMRRPKSPFYRPHERCPACSPRSDKMDFRCRSRRTTLRPELTMALAADRPA